MSSRTTPALRSPNDKLFTYPSMAVAFLATAAEANGQIVYTDVDPDEVLIGSTFVVDFDSDGAVDVKIFQVEVGNSGIAAVSAADAFLGSVYATSFGSTQKLPYRKGSGDPITAADPNWRMGSGTLFIMYTSAVGNWEGQAGYLGVRFIGGDGYTHYGWVELEVAPNGTQVIVKAYAYGSAADEPINAGDTGMSTAVQVHGASTLVTHYPNPASDQLFVSGLSGTAEVRILDVTGHVVQGVQMAFGDVTDRTALEVGSLPAGPYLLEVRQGDRIERREFIKQ